MKYILKLFIFLPLAIFAQKTTLIKGNVKNNNRIPIENVSVEFGNTGTVTDNNGNYTLRIPVKEEVTIKFSHISYKTFYKVIYAKNRNSIRYSPTLVLKTEKLEEIVVKNNTNAAQGTIKIDATKAKNIIGANAGVENILMTLPGVNNNNELSTQYNVRGGNFDENLVYVNGIEVYRPFLVRSGQQEGLSFINPNMVQNINFSAGGFQAKYGDKLSSVLDITYKKPLEKTISSEVSLLGGSLTFESPFLNNKLQVISSFRYRDNSLFVNSKQIETNFRPRFTDLQSLVTYQISNKLSVSYLSNFSVNNYNYTPISRKTRFGTVADPLELTVFYDGKEETNYFTLFNALSADYKINEKLSLTTTISSYNTQEEEYFDIAASYNLGEVDTTIGSENFGEVNFSEGIGSQINHARNDLDALINTVQVRGTYKNNNQQQWNFGVKYQNENIKERIREWEVIDSLGFAIRPPNTLNNQQPYVPFTGPIIPFQNIREDNNVTINRLSGFTQFNKRTYWKEHEIWYNIGVRAHYWNTRDANKQGKNQVIVSPRAQFAIKPNWKKDMLFRFSGGFYAQPPTYREMKNFNGKINTDVKAQKSTHYVLGMDYSFNLWKRPFKLTTELYYKDMYDINAYAVDNVRIRYRADNVTTAYAYGLDIRLNGEFVPGSESWVSLGYLKTEENINNRGNISRPSDQRIKFGILFQDYVPNLPNLKAYLNLVYNSGVPGGAPAYSDVYEYQQRLRDYKRADLGVSYVFTDAKKQYKTGWLSNFKELTAGLELFNMFDIQNAITNTWVRDVYSKNQYGIPNFMTGRVLNFKFSIKI
ncbi:TonB-dependent receptor [Polaribacter tangerinus]|uniref:TonB-dependent receptor n=1 Tax=Polaribacter tangerinus TaxID=1920034 RepID=UPI000B4AFF75|nr:carboxypeptidase-like regulatory domain-containing protein [Polaribacter tangerinus]